MGNTLSRPHFESPQLLPKSDKASPPPQSETGLGCLNLESVGPSLGLLSKLGPAPQKEG